MADAVHDPRLAVVPPAELAAQSIEVAPEARGLTLKRQTRARAATLYTSKPAAAKPRAMRPMLNRLRRMPGAA
jgi:hypothetical protein